MTGHELDVRHLVRMTDDTGLFEHARGPVPRREHGYCLDDVARGLLLLAREPEPTAEQLRLSGVYLAFTAHAQDGTGAFHNRLGYDRHWTDEPGTGDWWGRAMWGLGAVAGGTGPAWHRREALERFTLGCGTRSPWLRAAAFAALGAAEVLSSHPDHAGARALLVDYVVTTVRHPGGAWPWPEERLSYANASVAEALLAAGVALDSAEVAGRGEALLDWLVRRQTVAGHLSPVPVGGAGPHDRPPGFDQQPIEVAALADAAARAAGAGDRARWQPVVAMAAAWFDGANDGATVMHDVDTGGGYDGLTPAGPNLNQGAESTVAWLLTAQLARDLGGAG